MVAARDQQRKQKAWSRANSARARGKLICPGQCSRCGASDKQIGTPEHPRAFIEAHHPDYSKPLEVLWLCQPCHMAEHKRIKRESNSRKARRLRERDRLEARKTDPAYAKRMLEDWLYRGKEATANGARAYAKQCYAHAERWRARLANSACQ